MKFHEYLAYQFDASRKTQKEIATEIGYPRPNVVAMFKSGATKVPIEKVPLLAKSLGIDKAKLLQMALQEYLPNVWETIEQVFDLGLTDNEREIILRIRELTDNKNPKHQFSDQEEKLEEYCKSLTNK